MLFRKVAELMLTSVLVSTCIFAVGCKRDAHFDRIEKFVISGRMLEDTFFVVREYCNEHKMLPLTGDKFPDFEEICKSSSSSSRDWVTAESISKFGFAFHRGLRAIDFLSDPTSRPLRVLAVDRPVRFGKDESGRVQLNVLLTDGTTTSVILSRNLADKVLTDLAGGLEVDISEINKKQGQ